MKKPLVLAALSGLILVGAAYPGPDNRDEDEVASSEGGRTYRPCRSRRDDNCIQLYERGVRAAYARWLRDGDPGYDEAVRYAVYDDRRYGGHRRHHARDGHRAHGAEEAPRTRLAMVDVTRCDDHVAHRPAARSQRAPRPDRPAHRPRMYEDSGVRGM